MSNAGYSTCPICNRNWLVVMFDDCCLPACGCYGNDTSANNPNRPCESCGIRHAYACLKNDEGLAEMKIIGGDYERTKEVENLRYKKLWTLQKIADYLDLSPTTIRNVLGKNTGNIKTAKLREPSFIEKTKNLTNDDLIKMLNVSKNSVSRHRSDIHHAVKGNGNIYKGFESEIFAYAWLKSNGIYSKLMGFHKPFDILALDIVRIGVMGVYKDFYPPSQRDKLINPSWRFQVRSGKIRDYVDFYLCIIMPTEEVFVIPAKKIPRHMEAIRFSWPTARPELSKWQHYLDAYDLIFRFAESCCD